jgi:hypothetical protein
MAELTVIYWRDIPTQVSAREGRKSAKSELPRRFMEAVDAAAMRAGLFNSDDYLTEWRRSETKPCAADLDAAVAAEIDALDGAYDQARLRTLVENGGKEVA